MMTKMPELRDWLAAIAYAEEGLREVAIGTMEQSTHAPTARATRNAPEPAEPAPGLVITCRQGKP